MAEMNRISRFFVNRSAARRSRRRLSWLQPKLALPPGASCLEIGCGNGEFADRFVASFRPTKYVASDLDPHQVEEAHRHLLKNHEGGVPPALELRAADMTALPFSSDSFDAVFAFVCLHHSGQSHSDFSRIPVALSEIDRVLRPSGHLVYSEILHREAIRKWLTDRGYALLDVERGFRHESVIARKRPAGTGFP
jgi:ubiquinone/menaquinone biosynthesis C-methylase UbiE